MVIYSLVAGGVSVGRLFLGGFIPGVTLGVALMIISYIIAVRRNYPKEKSYSLREAVTITKDALLGLFTAVIIIGGVISGIFTATEFRGVRPASMRYCNILRLQGISSRRSARYSIPR